MTRAISPARRTTSTTPPERKRSSASESPGPTTGPRGSLIRLLLCGFSLALLASSASGQELEHEPPPCMDTESFPLIEARVSPPDSVRLSVRFMADGDGDWYEVPLREVSGSFRGALPKPLPDAVRVKYYIASSSEGLRTSEFVVNVLAGGCPGAHSTPGEPSGGIEIRRTASGQSEIPRGFSADGVRSGGMMSRGTLGIVAGAAGGATVAALALMGESPDAPRPRRREPTTKEPA